MSIQYIIIEKETKTIYTTYNDIEKDKIPEFYFTDTDTYMHIVIPKTIEGCHTDNYKILEDFTVALIDREVERIEKEQWDIIRAKRNQLLADCDWRMCRDIPVNKQWDDYRQQLRDLPTTYIHSADVVFPLEPGQ